MLFLLEAVMMVGKVIGRALKVFVKERCRVEILYRSLEALWGRFVMAGVVVVTPARRQETMVT